MLARTFHIHLKPSAAKPGHWDAVSTTETLAVSQPSVKDARRAAISAVVERQQLPVISYPTAA